MKNLRKKIKEIAISSLIAGIAFFNNGQASAQDNINSSQYTRRMSLDELVDRTSEFTTAKSILIIGFGHSVNDTKNLENIGTTNAFGQKFDYIFSSNYTGNKITNALHCVFTNVGVPIVDSLGMKGVEKIKTDYLEVHSQGNDQFISLANAGLIKAKTINLIAPPLASGPAYISKLENAVMKTGAKEVRIYQNLGKEDNFLDNDHFTTTAIPSLQLQDSGTSAVTLGVKIPFDNFFSGNNKFGNGTKVEWYRLYTSPGNDKHYTRNNIDFYNVHKVPSMGHGLKEAYYPNIIEVSKRYNTNLGIPITDLGKTNILKMPDMDLGNIGAKYYSTTPSLPYSPKGLTGNINVGGQIRTVPIAPPNFYKYHSLPQGYKGLTGNINVGGQIRTVPIAPPNFYKYHSFPQNNFNNNLPKNINIPKSNFNYRIK